jgi:putative NADH-flavin reductase
MHAQQSREECPVPVIIIGADTTPGPAIVDALTERDGEVRAFVTAIETIDELRSKGVKTAAGDISDGTHVGGAALNAFAAVIVAEAAFDDRERAFAADPKSVYTQWADGLRDAGVTRAIWVDDAPIPTAIATAVREHASVGVSGRSPEEIAAEVARLDEAGSL